MNFCLQLLFKVSTKKKLFNTTIENFLLLNTTVMVIQMVIATNIFQLQTIFLHHLSCVSAVSEHYLWHQNLRAHKVVSYYC